jgi:hypothetical protein
MIAREVAPVSPFSPAAPGVARPGSEAGALSSSSAARQLTRSTPTTSRRVSHGTWRSAGPSGWPTGEAIEQGAGERQPGVHPSPRAARRGSWRRDRLGDCGARVDGRPRLPVRSNWASRWTPGRLVNASAGAAAIGERATAPAGRDRRVASEPGRGCRRGPARRRGPAGALSVPLTVAAIATSPSGCERISRHTR